MKKLLICLTLMTAGAASLEMSLSCSPNPSGPGFQGPAQTLVASNPTFTQTSTFTATDTVTCKPTKTMTQTPTGSWTPKNTHTATVTPTGTLTPVPTSACP